MEFATMLELLGSGLVFTIQIFLTTLVGALPLGIVVAFCRMSRFKPLALVTRFYISVMRGTPLMLQLMALMFGPYYLFGMQMGNDWKYIACSVGTVKNLAHFSDSLISPPSGAATPPAESRPDSASSPTRSRPRT